MGERESERSIRSSGPLQDLFALGLSGKQSSRIERQALAAFLDLPRGLSSSAFLDAINALYTKEEIIKQVELWRREADKK